MTYEDYKKWEEEKGGNIKDVEYGYNKALEMYKQRIDFEQKIKGSVKPNDGT